MASTLSQRQINAILRAAKAAQTDAKKSDRELLLEQFAELLAPVAAAAITDVPKTDRDDSTHAGWSLAGITFEVDGTPVKVSFTVTDVTRVAEKTAEMEKFALAYVAALSADEDADESVEG